MASDTTPNKVDPTTVDGYEPPVEGETRKEARARRARNRRKADKAQAAAAGVGDTPKPVGRPSVKSKREQAVLGILTGAGIAAMAFDSHDGEVIIEGAPDLAAALAKVAEKNAKVARALDSLTETSAWAEVGIAAAAIVVPIVKHHATPPAERHPDPEPPTPPDAEAGAPSPQVAPDAPVFTVSDDPAPDPVPTFRA